jgi:hypothetical protein
MDDHADQSPAGQDSTITLAGIQDQYPRWRCWHGHATDTYYAIRACYSPRVGYQIRADDLTGLYVQIRAADSTPGDDLPVITLGFGFSDDRQIAAPAREGPDARP